MFTKKFPKGLDFLTTMFILSGSKAVHVTVGGNFVYALTPCGEMFCRYGISEDNTTGNYWKKHPGVMASLSGFITHYFNRRIYIFIIYSCHLPYRFLIVWHITKLIIIIPLCSLMITLSVTWDDELWGINNDGQLFNRLTIYLKRHAALEELRTAVVQRRSNEEGDWELIWIDLCKLVIP